MEDWKLPALKSHLQFSLGRVDGCRWVLERIDILNDDDNIEEKTDIQDKIKDWLDTANECERLIQKALDKREAIKQQRLDAQAALHETFRDKS